MSAATLRFALLLASIFTTHAASSGILDINSCLDAKTEPWGCDPTKYVNGDHLQCTNDPNMGHMEWTGRPVYSSAFTLRTGLGALGDDRRTYKPNKWLSVWLTVTDYRQKYRGLLLHAVDSNNTFVGQWNITSNGKDAMFRNPPTCLRSIMHSQAELKPLRVRFRFLAPPPGTGTISFRCLIKVGPANDGWFYWPNGNDPNLEGATPVGGGRGIGADLTLEEEPARRPSAIEWALGSAGQSCSDACASRSMKCDEDAMRSSATTTGPGLDAHISDVVSCPLPYKPTCSAVAPARSSDGTCWYNAANSDWMRTNVCSRVGGGATPQAMSSCGSRHSDASRFCACRRSGGARPQSLDDDAAWDAEVGLAEGAASSDDEIQGRTSTSEPGLAAMLKAFGQVGALLALFKLGGLKAMITGWLLLCAPVASAHNWMRSPARAGFEASTQKPFRQRKSYDIHAQLGPGQKMAIKWATGHSRPHYFVVISGQDEEKTRDSRYLTWVEDYIASAPAGANKAAQNPRLHSCKRESDCASASYYSGRVSSSDADFCEHPMYPDGTNLWRYNPSETANDVFLFYESEAYPWIIGVLKYDNNYHQPSDEDIACLPVPERQGKGRHYIVHWVWRGYYDAVDVHTHPTAVPADLIYGNQTSQYAWTKIDHCQYTQPKRFLTPVFDATDDVRSCRAIIDAQSLDSDSNSLYRIGQPGINVVPYTNPPQVLHSDAVATPFGYDVNGTGIEWPMDYQSIPFETMEIEGTPSYHTVDPSAWASRTTVTQGVTCATTMTVLQEVTWRYAVEDCLAYYDTRKRKCGGIAWFSEGRPQSEMYVGNHTFRRCTGSTTTASSDYTMFVPRSVVTTPPTAGYVDPETYTDSNHDVYKISFQPSSPPTSAPISLPSGWKVDSGETYGNRGNGLSYGWRCATGGSTNFISVSTSNFNNPAMDDYYTGLANSRAWSSACADGQQNTWEMAIPNGVYLVTMGGGNRCMVENIRGNLNSPINVVTVEVRDGRLTITDVGQRWRSLQDNSRVYKGCGTLWWLRVDKLRNSLPESWLPGTTSEAWWQTELSESSTEIGIVTVEAPRSYRWTSAQGPRPVVFGKTDCRQRWLLDGRSPQCYLEAFYLFSRNGAKFPDDIVVQSGYKNSSRSYPNAAKFSYYNAQVGGKFEDNGDGFVVAVADEPCTDANGCPTSSERVCEVVTRYNRCQNNENQEGPCAYKIDCKGMKGRYVRVRLRRSSSAKKLWPLATAVKVHRRKLELDTRLSTDTRMRMVCYGLDPKIGATTAPSFTVAEDPEDPVFYSTCYKRERKTIWLPIGDDSDNIESRWAYGSNCLSCNSYNANDAQYNMTLMSTPQWELDGTCIDCRQPNAGFAAMTDSGDSGSDRADGVGGMTGAQVGGVVAGAILFVGAGVAVGVWCMRRKQPRVKYHVEEKERVQLRKSSRQQLRATAIRASSPDTETVATLELQATTVSNLPPNWQRVHDDRSGQYYFFNNQTGESQWEEPTGVVV